MLNHKMVVLGLVIMHLNLPHSQRHSFATLIVYAAGVEAIVSIKRGFSGRCIQSPSPPSPPLPFVYLCLIPASYLWKSLCTEQTMEIFILLAPRASWLLVTL